MACCITSDTWQLPISSWSSPIHKIFHLSGEQGKINLLSFFLHLKEKNLEINPLRYVPAAGVPLLFFAEYQWIMIPLQTCMTSGEADWELQAKKVDRSVPLNWMQDLWLISVNTENHSWILFESLNRTDSCLSFYICSLQSCFKYHNWFKINNIYICCSKNLRVSYMLTGKYYQCDIFTSHGNPLMWIYPLLGLQGQNKSIIHVFKNS